MFTKNLSFILSVMFLALNQSGLAKQSESSNGYLPYLQIGGTRFFNVDAAKWASGLDFFIPLWQSPLSHLVFTHLRFYDRSSKPFEGNVHVGYRYLSDDETRLHGIYGAFDRKRSAFGNYFNQLTFGVESWFNQIYIGANFYQPIGRNLRPTAPGDDLKIQRIGENSNIWNILWTPQRGERAAGGGDIEVGYEFIQGLTGYVGGYYFKAKAMDAVSGPKAKLAYDYSLDHGKRILGIFDKVGLEVGAQHDKRGAVGYLNVNLKIGLLSGRNANLRGLSRHMVDLVRRDVDIITQEGVVGGGKSKVLTDSVGKEIRLIEWSADTDPSTLKGVDESTHNIVIFKGKIDQLSDQAYQWLNKNAIYEGKSVLEFVSPYSGRKLVVDLKTILGDEPDVATEVIKRLNSGGSVSNNVPAASQDTTGVLDTTTIDSPGYLARGTQYMYDIYSWSTNQVGDLVRRGTGAITASPTQRKIAAAVGVGGVGLVAAEVGVGAAVVGGGVFAYRNRHNIHGVVTSAFNWIRGHRGDATIAAGVGGASIVPDVASVAPDVAAAAPSEIDGFFGDGSKRVMVVPPPVQKAKEEEEALKAAEQQAEIRAVAAAETEKKAREEEVAIRAAEQQAEIRAKAAAETEKKAREEEKAIKAAEQQAEVRAKAAAEAEKKAREEEEAIRAAEQQAEIRAKAAVKIEKKARQEEEALKAAKKQADVRAKAATETEKKAREEEKAIKAAEQQAEIRAKAAAEAEKKARQEEEALKAAEQAGLKAEQLEQARKTEDKRRVKEEEAELRKEGEQARLKAEQLNQDLRKGERMTAFFDTLWEKVGERLKAGNLDAATVKTLKSNLELLKSEWEESQSLFQSVVHPYLKFDLIQIQKTMEEYEGRLNKLTKVYELGLISNQ